MAKKVIKDIVVAGALGGLGYAGIAAGYVLVGAVVVGVYVFQKYGKYWTLIKYSYYTNECLKECKKDQFGP